MKRKSGKEKSRRASQVLQNMSSGRGEEAKNVEL